MRSSGQATPGPARWSRKWIERRKSLETGHLGYAGPDNPPDITGLPWPYRCLDWSLKASGLYGRGRRNFLDVGLTRIEHKIPHWPSPLEGYRILHLSDLHIDLDPALLEPLCQVVQGLQSDLVVFTGDYWEGSNTSLKQALDSMRILLETLEKPRDGIYGVLGNHDPVALGFELEGMGLKILVNEGLEITSGEGAYYLAGVDDPYFFKLDDLDAALANCRGSMPRILLSHSPQIAREAQAAGVDLLFSGHTHGGQVCLPGGRSMVTMEKIPPAIFKGLWRCGSLRGYTSTGAGACHLPVRFNCPAEVVLHSLTGETG